MGRTWAKWEGVQVPGHNNRPLARCIISSSRRLLLLCVRRRSEWMAPSSIRRPQPRSHGTQFPSHDPIQPLNRLIKTVGWPGARPNRSTAPTLGRRAHGRTYVRRVEVCPTPLASHYHHHHHAVPTPTARGRAPRRRPGAPRRGRRLFGPRRPAVESSSNRSGNTCRATATVPTHPQQQ